MNCSKCGKTHSDTAIYCPHCGAEVSGEGRQAGSGAAGSVTPEEAAGITGTEGAPVPAVEVPRGRKPTFVTYISIFLVLLLSGGVTVWRVYNSMHRSSRSAQEINEQTRQLLEQERQRMLDNLGNTANAEAAYDAALAYAESTGGKPGLVRDTINFNTTGTSDVFLKDPVTGKRYHVYCIKAADSWTAVSMDEAQ